MTIALTPLDIGESTSTTLNLSNLTSGAINGTGVFDVLMNVVSQHIASEFDKGRVTGKEYATVYLGSVSAVLQASVAYLTADKEVERINAEIGLTRQKIVTELSQTDDTIPLGLGFNGTEAVEGSVSRQNSHVTAQTALVAAQEPLIEAQTSNQLAQVGLTTAQKDMQLAQATTIPSQIALTEAQTDVQEAQAGAIPGQILLTAAQKDSEIARALTYPAQIALITAQTAGETAKIALYPAQIALTEAQAEAQVAQKALYPAQVSLTTAQTAGEVAKTAIVPKQGVLLDKQAEHTVAQGSLIVAQTAGETAKTTTLIPKQATLLEKQALKTVEEANLTTAQAAIIPIQGELYSAQKDGYARDAEQKLTKIFVDSWQTRRLTDETGTAANTINHLDDTSVGTVVAKAKQGIGVA